MHFLEKNEKFDKNTGPKLYIISDQFKYSSFSRLLIEIIQIKQSDLKMNVI